MLEFNVTSVESILAMAVSVFFLIQLFYWLGPYSRLRRLYKKKKSEQVKLDKLPPLSVVMVTKDSGKMLEQNLPAILEQDYPEFEVIVVNDMSSGEDEDILKLLESRYRHLYHTFIPNSARYISLRKLGIAMGIKASKYDWIVVTEPNCRPVSDKWLQSLASEIDYRTDIVLGYSNYVPDDESSAMFFRRVVTDTLFHSMRFLGKAIGGRPYMGIGRNMAYRKSIYERRKGFFNQLNLQRGDDDLFINSIATNRNTRVAVSPHSIVRVSMPYKRLWLSDKVNLLVTGRFYKGFSRVMNGLETWTSFLLNYMSVGIIISSVLTQQYILAGIVFLLWLIRMITVMVVMKKTAVSMGENKLYPVFVFDLIRPFWSFDFKLRYWFRDKYDFVRHK